jgi:hypothetical protein
MINMRSGTDEDGWRYNAWFRSKGWKSHAGGVGWGGWVRRREMVRLRGTKRVVEGERNKLDNRDTEWHKLKPSLGLGNLMNTEEVNENVERVMRSLGRLPLDRQKLEVWRKWLDEGDHAVLQKVQQVIDEEDGVSNIPASLKTY